MTPKQTEREYADMKCALCNEPLVGGNASKEHVIPNALGGRKTVENFICAKCNSKTGADWDNALIRQLGPLCTMLNIRRDRGRNQPMKVETLSGKALRIHPDGTMEIAKPTFERHERDGRTEVRMSAGTTKEIREMVSGLAGKNPEIDIEEVMRNAPVKREYSREPFAISLEPGGIDAGRSIVKSCLAMACDQGLTVRDCGEAARFLPKGRDPCFGYHCGPDLVRNRPEGTFFHCVHVCGDPERGRLLGYVEYFGWLRFLVCLSRNYGGGAFSRGYAIDPVSGKDLDLTVDLALETADVTEIFEQRKVDFSGHERSLNALVGAWKEMDRNRARHRAVDFAVKSAGDDCGIKEGDVLSDERAMAFARTVSKHLEPYLMHEFSGSRLTGEELAEIKRRSMAGGT